MQYLLDTDICIKLMRGDLNVTGNVSFVGEQACFISEITIAELRYGAEFSQRPDFHHKQIDNFQLVARAISILAAIPVYAAQKARLRRAGLPLPDFDLLIGATALAHGMVMVTNNEEHLSRITGLEIDNWLTSPPPSDQ